MLEATTAQHMLDDYYTVHYSKSMRPCMFTGISNALQVYLMLSAEAQSESLEHTKPKMAPWLHYLGFALVSRHRGHHSSKKPGAMEVR